MLREYNTNKRKVNNPQNLFYIDQSSNIVDNKDFHEIFTVNDDVDNDITFNIVDVMNKDEQLMVGLMLMKYKKQDIARIMGVSKDTITNWLNALRNKLRHHFEKIGIFYYNI